MQTGKLVAVVSTDKARRETIVRAFTAAGLETIAAATTAELDVSKPTEPFAFVLDGFQLDVADALSQVRSRWPGADVWAVCETARHLSGERRTEVVAEPAARHPSCESILEGVLQKLPMAAGSPVEAADKPKDTEQPGKLGRAAASIIHELNNPLAALLGFVEILRESGACPAEFQDDLEQIEHEARRCRRIIDNLLHLARPPQLIRRPTDIHDPLERAITVRSYQAPQADTGVVRNFAEDIPAVMVDPDHIEQIVLNLLTNAEEATQAVGPPQAGTAAHITVSTRAEGGELLISVADNGPGIAQENLASVFDPLFSTRSSSKGAGLGLSVSRTLARQHGGDIEAANREQGGAVFTVRLPLIAAPKPAETAAKHWPPKATRHHVLVLDGRAVVRSTIARMLGPEAYTVAGCATPEEALRALESQEPDVIIADLALLQFRGRALVQRLRQHHPELADKLILATTGVQDWALDPAKYSQNPVLPKPFTCAQLRQAVLSVLREDSGGRTSVGGC